MKAILLIVLSLWSLNGYAGSLIDLSDPKYAKYAEMYPNHNFLHTVSFAETEGGKLSVFALKNSRDNSSINVAYAARIMDINNNKQPQVFIETPFKCTDVNGSYEDVIIDTNTQYVRYTVFCSGTHKVLTPKSQSGVNFLVTQFKSERPVGMDFPDVFVMFDASGFSESWRNLGGDVL